MRNVSFIILTLEIYKVLLPISMSIFLLPSCRGQSFHHTHKKKGIIAKIPIKKIK